MELFLRSDHGKEPIERVLKELRDVVPVLVGILDLDTFTTIGSRTYCVDSDVDFAEIQLQTFIQAFDNLDATILDSVTLEVIDRSGKSIEHTMINRIQGIHLKHLSITA